MDPITPPPRPRNNLRPLLIPPLLTLLAVIASYVIAGPSLNFYLDLLVAAAIVVPPAILIRTAWPTVLIAAALGAAIAAIACVAVGWQAHLAIPAALQCAAVILAFANLIAWLALFLKTLRLPPPAAALTSIMIALAWLTIPFWISATAMVHWIPVHPVFAINRAAIDLGIWTEQPLAYRLTRLGQDVPYTLPRSIRPCVATQILIAEGLSVIAIIARRRWRRRHKLR